jgi:hypothetical protein
MNFFKKIKMCEILCVTTFNITCIFSFDTKCVHYTMETPHNQAIVQLRRSEILEENLTKNQLLVAT